MRTQSGTLNVVAIAVVLLFALSFAGRVSFVFDNLSSFRVHFALALLVLSLACLLTRRFSLAGLTAFCLLVDVLQIWPWQAPMSAANATQSESAVSVFSSNVSPRNDSPERLLALLERESPDIVGLIEVTPKFHEGLASLASRYPYRVEVPAPGYMGMVLYSRLPLDGATEMRFGEHSPPAIIATLHNGEQRVQLIVMHPKSPMGPASAAERNATLRVLAEYICRSNRPTVVLGDMNTALWSPHYKDFVNESGLINTRAGRSVAGTWPPSRQFGVPIDHVFVSAQIQTLDFRVLDRIGSDHLPILARLRLDGPDAQETGAGGPVPAAGGPLCGDTGHSSATAQ